ncbi:hypothetical protein SUDANB9_00577 [Streptomyces sp. enrichment culture]
MLTDRPQTVRPVASRGGADGVVFRRLADEGTTLLVSSHVMDEADRCDRLLLMRSGHLPVEGRDLLTIMGNGRIECRKTGPARGGCQSKGGPRHRG